eukprot:UN12894
MNMGHSNSQSKHSSVCSFEIAGSCLQTLYSVKTMMYSSSLLHIYQYLDYHTLIVGLKRKLNGTFIKLMLMN